MQQCPNKCSVLVEPCPHNRSSMPVAVHLHSFNHQHQNKFNFLLPPSRILHSVYRLRATLFRLLTCCALQCFHFHEYTCTHYRANANANISLLALNSKENHIQDSHYLDSAENFQGILRVRMFSTGVWGDLSGCSGKVPITTDVFCQ